MFRKLRIQGRMQIFEKKKQKALNHDLTLPLHSTRRELPESSGILEKAKICMRPWLRRLPILLGRATSRDVIWLNTSTGLRYKRHILHARKYDTYL